MTRVDILPAREVPLGGLRSMNVFRALPQRGLPTVGAWCFLDRFGPQRVDMRVDPHPHIGLQTVTWPLKGEVRHRDSLGSDVVLRAGDLNLMTSGAGIAHSEYSLPGEGGEAPELDAVQFWIALPSGARDGARDFAQHTDLPRVSLPAQEGADADAVVVMGTLAGVSSPARAYTPLVGAQVTIAPGSRLQVPLEADWEHAVVLLEGDVAVGGPEGVCAVRNDLNYLGAGLDSVELASDTGAVVFLLGGEPLDEELVMWWNFVGRSHEEIEEAWHGWQSHSARFGEVAGHGEVRIPAPPLPTVRLKSRGAPLRRDVRVAGPAEGVS